ncbi:MAG: acyltransferase family protein [Atopobiaceae bacterium]|nr:acyltransferase family protein [Atopobiaceae bacterium]
MGARKQSRLEYIDVARGIAMICIVLGHLGSPDINRVVFTFHVPIFYLITGYFISDRTRLRTFVGKRARMLLIPYAVTALIVTICNPLVNEFVLGGKHSKDLMLTWAGAALYGAGDAWDLPFFPFMLGAWVPYGSFGHPFGDQLPCAFSSTKRHGFELLPCS